MAATEIPGLASSIQPRFVIHPKTMAKPDCELKHEKNFATALTITRATGPCGNPDSIFLSAAFGPYGAATQSLRAGLPE